MYFLGCKRLSNDDIEVAGGTRISEDTAGGWLVSKPAMSLKKPLGGGYRRRATLPSLSGILHCNYIIAILLRFSPWTKLTLSPNPNPNPNASTIGDNAGPTAP